MTGRCETCVQWQEVNKPSDGREFMLGDAFGPLDVAYQPSATWAERKRERQKDLGHCDAAVFFEAVSHDEPVPAIVVADGSGYRAQLFTRRDFGCTEWVTRSEES